MPETIDPTPTPAVSTVFPQQIEVTFTLKLTVNEQLERDFWFEPGTTNVTLDAAADIFDILSDYYPILESVNNLTHEQIQQVMSEREV
jgi:hypothetical protein